MARDSQRHGSGRYTPPHEEGEHAERKWPIVIAAACGLVGLVVIILNFLLVLPGSESSWYVIAGLVVLAVGLGFTLMIGSHRRSTM